MRWLILSLLIASCTIDYGHKNFPLVLHVDSDFSNEEVELIRRAIQEVNLSFGARVGHDIIVFGTIVDDDFDPDTDFEDGTHVMYHVDPDSYFGEWAASVNDGDFGGWASMQDIAINGEKELKLNLVLHEMGHFLGLLHDSRTGNMMSDDGPRPENGRYGPGDIQSFCFIYDCAYNPPPRRRPDYDNEFEIVAYPATPEPEDKVKLPNDERRNPKRNRK